MSAITHRITVREQRLAKLFICEDGFSTSSRTVPINGESIEEIAQSELCCEHVFAIQIGTVVGANTKINGQPVQIFSSPSNLSPMTFLGGKVIDLTTGEGFDPDMSQAERMLRDFITPLLVEADGTDKFIACRTGNIEPFCPDKGDKILPLGNESETKSSLPN